MPIVTLGLIHQVVGIQTYRSTAQGLLCTGTEEIGSEPETGARSDTVYHYSTDDHQYHCGVHADEVLHQ